MPKILLYQIHQPQTFLLWDVLIFIIFFYRRSKVLLNFSIMRHCTKPLTSNTFQFIVSNQEYIKIEEMFAHTYSTAAIWSFTSTDPNDRWTSWRILSPWNPLPLPSNRATMTLSELTSTESQSMWNLSVTNWLPGASSL